MPLKEVGVKCVHYLQASSVPGDRQLQLECDRMQNLLGRYARVGQIHRLDVLRQPGLQHAAQHGFAAAYFAGYLDDAFAVRNSVNQRLEDRATIPSLEKDISVWCDLERRLVQSEERVIHYCPSSPAEA